MEHSGKGSFIAKVHTVHSVHIALSDRQTWPCPLIEHSGKASFIAKVHTVHTVHTGLSDRHRHNFVPS